MIGEHPNALLDRTTAGLRVQVAWLPVMQMGVVQCSVEDQVFSASVERDKLLDAFEHPMLYLSPAQIEALGIS